jgi:glutaminyl-peptide cyclotransferase
MHRAKALILLLCPTLLAAVEFSGASALKFTQQITAFGPRPAGSPALEKTRVYLKSQLKAFGCPVEEDRFVAQTPKGARTMVNLIVRMPGLSGRAVAITGHYDTKEMPEIRFVGANDGGASAGLLLELARVLCKAPRRNDVYLVWFDGEEAVVNWTDTDSLYGSRHLADRWQRDGTLKRIRALINVDMIGDRDLNIVNESGSNPAIRRLIWSTAAELGYSKQFGTVSGPIGDDHMPFVERGVPAVDLIDFDYGPNNSYWHTEKDTVDKLSAASFDVMGKVLLAVLRKLEN